MASFTDLLKNIGYKAIQKPAGVFFETMERGADSVLNALGVDTQNTPSINRMLGEEDLRNYEEDPAREIAKAVATSASYAIPGGGGRNLAEYLLRGAVSGGLGGYGGSDVGNELKDTLAGVAVGGALSGGGYFTDLVKGSPYKNVLSYNVNRLPNEIADNPLTRPRITSLNRSLPPRGIVGYNPFESRLANTYTGSSTPLYNYESVLKNTLPAQRGNLLNQLTGSRAFNYGGDNYIFGNERTYQDATNEILPLLRTLLTRYSIYDRDNE